MGSRQRDETLPQCLMRTKTGSTGLPRLDQSSSDRLRCCCLDRPSSQNDPSATLATMGSLPQAAGWAGRSYPCRASRAASQQWAHFERARRARQVTRCGSRGLAGSFFHSTSVRLLSEVPARFYGIRERGRIVQRCFADLWSSLGVCCRPRGASVPRKRESKVIGALSLQELRPKSFGFARLARCVPIDTTCRGSAVQGKQEVWTPMSRHRRGGIPYAERHATDGFPFKPADSQWPAMKRFGDGGSVRNQWHDSTQLSSGHPSKGRGTSGR